MHERWKGELLLVEAVHGPIDIAPDLAWFIMRRWSLPPGWSKRETAVLVLIPPGYPVTPPDNFFVDPDLRLANGGMPGNAGPETQAGKQWLRFSYHVESGDWKPHADSKQGHNLLTFLQGVGNRLAEVS